MLLLSEAHARVASQSGEFTLPSFLSPKMQIALNEYNTPSMCIQKAIEQSRKINFGFLARY